MVFKDIKLYDHQLSAVDESKPRYALFMQAGTGKTYTALATMLKHARGNVLILCPKSVVNEWQMSIEQLVQKPDITVMGIEAFARSGVAMNPSYIIVDEAHRTKEPTSKTYKKLSKLIKRDVGVLLLTGTPSDGDALENQLALASLLGLCDFWKAYKTWFVLDDYNVILHAKKGAAEYVNDVWKSNCFKLKTLELGVKLKEIKVVLPNNNKVVYERLNDGYEITNLDGTMSVMHSWALTQFKLQQVTSGYYKDTYENIIQLNNIKIDYMRQYLADHRKVVVFNKFVYDRERLVELCESMDLTYRVLDGSTNNTEKYIKEIKQFDFDVLIVNYMSGGVGLNLINSHNMVLYSLPWSFIQYEQAIKRIHRLGQKQDCEIKVLCVKNSVDDKIYKSIKHKQNFHDEFMEDK